MQLKHTASLPKRRASLPACLPAFLACSRARVYACVLEVPMAEFGEDGSLPPLNLGDTTVPSDEAAGKTHCEVSVLNGNCGISENMVGSGSLVAPGSQAGAETANTSVGLDAKSEIPRRSSIIKVKTQEWKRLSGAIHSGELAYTSVRATGCLKLQCKSPAPILIGLFWILLCMLLMNLASLRNGWFPQHRPEMGSPRAHHVLILNIPHSFCAKDPLLI